jgi:hypothetical protein
MKAIKFLFFSLLGILFASCAGLNTTPYTNNQVETKLILSEGNYRIVKEVNGEWSATYVLGIGGLSKRALKNNAISKMYQDAHLTGNQQIINVTTTQSVEVWALGIYMKVRAMAHGYVIEFIDQHNNPTLSMSTSQNNDYTTSSDTISSNIAEYYQTELEKLGWSNSILAIVYKTAIKQLLLLNDKNTANEYFTTINNLVEKICSKKISKGVVENKITTYANQTDKEEYLILLEIAQKY